MVNQAYKWQTKRLDCWDKFKELRMQNYLDIASAKENGKILVSGSIVAFTPLLSGLGDDVVFFGGEPYGANVGAIPQASAPAMAAVEERGYARTMCAYMRNYWGHMFTDRYLFTDGPFPRPDFLFTENYCEAGHGKWYQVVAEHEGIPLVVWDFPAGPFDTSVEQKVDYMAAQLNDCIEQMEKLTGRELDDEKFTESARYLFESECLWGEICLLNGAAIPTTLDLKSGVALVPIALNLRHKREGVEALRELRDEVKDRIAQHIAATPIERTRLMADLSAPWHMLPMFRSFEERGAVFVGSWFYTTNGGTVDFREDGTVTKAKTPDELGWPMKTREDVLRAWSRYELTHPVIAGVAGNPSSRTQQLISLHRHWKTAGIAMHLNRGCPLLSNGLPEVKMQLEDAGIPVVAYEGNFADPTDNDEAEIMKRLHAFVDLLEENSGSQLASLQM